MRPMDSAYEVRRVLCAVDHSEQSVRAAKVAAALAGKCAGELLLLTVLRVADTTQENIAGYLQHEHNPDPPRVVIEEAARNELCLLGDSIGKQSGVAISCTVRTGDAAAAEIVACATDRAADLVVVGHRGHNRLAQILLGSVARRVVELAPCPVLVVR